MNTYFGLLAEYGTAEIPLDRCCGVFGLSSAEAKRRAAMHDLPVPAYRAGSQKAPWLVSAVDLAKYLDVQKADARQEWRKMHAPTEMLRN